MKKALKRGGIMLGLLMAFALGCCTGINFRTSAGESTPIVENNKYETIENFRRERQQLRQMQLSQLNELIHSDDAESEIVSLARRRQIEIMDWSEKEQTLESVLALRDFQDVLVTVHTDSVNVMVKSESVSHEQAAVILELVTRETGISGGNVKIIPIN